MAAKRLKVIGDELPEESPGIVYESKKLMKVEPIDGVLHYTVSTEFKANSGNFESRMVGGSTGGTFSTDLDPAAVGEYLYTALYASLDEELFGAKKYAEGNPKSKIHQIPTDDYIIND